MDERKLFFLAIFVFTLLLQQSYGQQLQHNGLLPWHNLNIGSTKIKISGSFRLRGEIQDGYNIKTFGTGGQEDFLLSRLRLEMSVQFNKQARFHVQLQDAQVFGSSFSDQDFNSGNNPFHDPLDINQAYFEYQPLKAVKLTVGRQAISFRDRRIFGPGNWGNTGRYTWDAAWLALTNRYLDSNWIVGRFILHNPYRWPNKQADGPTAYACYTSSKALPLQFDVFYVFKDDERGITEGEKGTGDLASHSVGIWLKQQSGNWDYGATWVGQLGRWASDKIRAMGTVVSAGRKFNVTCSPYLQIQYIRGSGDKNPDDGIYNTFDGVFGGADTDLYGWMNLFFWKNINEYRINIAFNPGKKFNLRSEYHYFMLDHASDAWYFPGKAQCRDKTGSSGRELGHEIDVTARIKVNDYLELLMGTCFFMPGEFVKNTGKSPQASWCFLQTTFIF